MQTWEWVVIAVVLAGALVFTLLWWKIADFWADAEHKRFKEKGGSPGERVVIKSTGVPAAGAGVEGGGGGDGGRGGREDAGRGS